jgi:hypothetical protein
MALRGLTRLLGRSLNRSHARSPAEPLQLLAAWPEQHLSSTDTTVLGSTVGAAGNSTAAASGASSTTPSFQANYGVAARQLQNDLETYRVSVVTGNLRGEAAAAAAAAAAVVTSSSSSIPAMLCRMHVFSPSVMRFCRTQHASIATNPPLASNRLLLHATLTSAPYPCASWF